VRVRSGLADYEDEQLGDGGGEEGRAGFDTGWGVIRFDRLMSNGLSANSTMQHSFCKRIPCCRLLRVWADK
jgi:hypothetical protein